MIEFISQNFSQIAKKCLERNAKEFGVEKTEVQLVFKYKDVKSEEVDYLIMEKYKPKKVLTFLQVLGVKIDFKGYSFFVPKFIAGSLKRFCSELSIDANDVSVVLHEHQSGKLIMWLYNKNKPTKQFTLESLFNPEDLIVEENS